MCVDIKNNICCGMLALAAWGPQLSGHPADLNGDSFVDTADFLLLLANWGACP